MTDEFDFSNARPDELRSIIIASTIIDKRNSALLKAAKAAWAQDHDGGDIEDCNFNGMDAGTITLTRGRNSWEQRNYPKPEAMTDEFLENLIHAHGGELPPGVEYKPGRPQTVTLRLPRGFVNKAFQADQIANTLKLLEGNSNEQ